MSNSAIKSAVSVNRMGNLMITPQADGFVNTWFLPLTDSLGSSSTSYPGRKISFRQFNSHFSSTMTHEEFRKAVEAL